MVIAVIRALSLLCLGCLSLLGYSCIVTHAFGMEFGGDLLCTLSCFYITTLFATTVRFWCAAYFVRAPCRWAVCVDLASPFGTFSLMLDFCPPLWASSIRE